MQDQCLWCAALRLIASIVMERMRYGKVIVAERFGRLGRVRDVDREHSGSAVDFALRRDQSEIDPVSASLAIAKRELSLLRAKRAIELVLKSGEARVRLPVVSSARAVIKELRKSGIQAVRCTHADTDDLHH